MWFPDIVKDIMLYFIKQIRVYGCNLSLPWSSVKNRMPQNFTIVNFWYPVSKSWLRPGMHISSELK